MKLRMIKKGFTLIELLVVISIISILTATATASFMGVRTRTRDGVRKSDLRQMQSALELYRADVGAYPDPASIGACGTQFTGVNNNITYLKSIPCDPNSGSAYVYTPAPTGCSSSSTACSGYMLTACLENSNDSEKDSTKNPSCPTASMTVSNP